MTYLKEEEFENYSIKKEQVNRWISQYFPKSKDDATIGDLIGIIEDLDGEIENLKEEIKSYEEGGCPPDEYDAWVDVQLMEKI